MDLARVKVGDQLTRHRARRRVDRFDTRPPGDRSQNGGGCSQAIDSQELCFVQATLLSKPLTHLTASAVKAIHAEVLAAHGGSPGIREEALLESAVAAPQATMMGEPLISDPVEIAAAYLFYLCRNRPFIDGNKRTALAACLVFLQTNDFLPT